MKKRRRHRLWYRMGGILLLVYVAYAGLYLARLVLPGTKIGAMELQTGQLTLFSDPAAAADHFAKAGEAFSDSFARLRQAPLWAKIVTPLPPFRWQVRMLKASHTLSQIGQQASQLAVNFPEIDTNEASLVRLLGDSSRQYFDWYFANQPVFLDIKARLAEAETELEAVPAWSIYGQRKSVESLQSEISRLRLAYDRWLEGSNQLYQGLGGNQPDGYKNIIVVFQNDAELRPSGGFIGSYAKLVASNGIIRQFQFGTNVYKLDKALRDKARGKYPTNPVSPGNPSGGLSLLSVLNPPEPLTAISDFWGFRDSNVSCVFRDDCAKQVAQFYSLATNEKVDLLVFIDASVLVDILRLTGPVKLPGSDDNIDANNARPKLSESIEIDYFKTEENRIANEPKQILADLIPALVSQLGQTPNAAKNLGLLGSTASLRKSLWLWSPNRELNDYFLPLLPEDAPRSGRAWLKVVNTNLGGLKSSLNVAQEVQINEKTDRKQDRRVFEVEIIRRHQGDGKWPDGDNHNYMEIYLPEEAEVLELPRDHPLPSPLRIEDQEELGIIGKIWSVQEVGGSGWRRIGLWASTEVGRQSQYTFRFAFPGTDNQDGLLYLKQAGSGKETIQMNDDEPIGVQTNVVL